MFWYWHERHEKQNQAREEEKKELCSQVHMLQAHSVYLLYWYKGTKAAEQAEAGRWTCSMRTHLLPASACSAAVSICTFVPVKQVN
jgi:hypothetical protein